MSGSDRESAADGVEPKRCEFCGGYSTEVDQDCPALDEGWCLP